MPKMLLTLMQDDEEEVRMWLSSGDKSTEVNSETLVPSLFGPNGAFTDEETRFLMAALGAASGMGLAIKAGLELVESLCEMEAQGTSAAPPMYPARRESNEGPAYVAGLADLLRWEDDGGPCIPGEGRPYSV